MIEDIALIMVSVVLFIHMGLADAICRVTKVRFWLLQCPKCLTFWCELLYLLIVARMPVLQSIAISFIMAYLALWIELCFGYVSRLYEILSDELYSTNTTTKDDEQSPPDGQQTNAEGSVPSVWSKILNREDFD